VTPLKPKQSVSVSTAAALLGCSTRRVQHLIEEGKLHATRISTRGWWRIDRLSLLELLRNLDAELQIQRQLNNNT